MTPERWSQIKDIFAAVTDLSAEERTPALIQACHGDTDLQAELERLLAQNDEMGGFLDGSPPASAASLLSPGSLLANRYQIVALLGSGGMGEVYEAQDRELGGRIALKVVHPQMAMNDTRLDRFRREVHLARHVTHPNVCRVFDIGRHHQQGSEIVFLTMEFLPGETLSARLKREGRIPLPEARAIVLQLCQALGAAHEAGVLHRDFKPGNVMLTGSGERVRAIVTDFGIARWIGNSPDFAGTLTAQGAIFGTPAYMSPEQIQGKELTVATDIYSLGLVLYEMVTGVRPFHDESSWGETLKRLTADPPEARKAVADLDQTWNRTILRCLDRDPAKRFATMRDAAAALAGETEPSGSFLHRHRRLSAVAAITTLIAASGLIAFREWVFRPLPAEKHIAVLPFKFAGGDSANQAMAYGLAESLTHNLLQLTAGSSTWVVPWRAIRERPANDDSPAGPALGANLVLVGEMERRDGRLRMTSQLKNADTLRTLRTGVIDIPEAEAVTIESKLLAQTASMLKLNVTPGSLQSLQVRYTPAPGAYEFYEQGRGYLLRRTSDDNGQAIILLKKAIEKDPAFALAKANLAVAYEWKYRDTKDQRWLDESRAVCGQALELNNKSIPGHLAQGLILRDSGNLDGAIQELQQALVLDPANEEARNSLAITYDQAGRTHDSENLLQETLNRNPANWFNYNDLGYFYYQHRKYGLAEPLFRSAMELAPGNPRPFLNLGGLYLVLGRNNEAEEILRRGIAIKPTSGAYSNLGTLLRSEGRYAESAAMLEKAVELAPGDPRLWWNLGNVYSDAGNKAKADKAYQENAEAIQKLLLVRPGDNQLWEDLAISNAVLHLRKQALEALSRVTGPAARTPDALFNSAMVFELIGDRARALSTLQAARRAGVAFQKIQGETVFDKLRADPRYVSMVRDQGPGKDAP